MIIKTESHHFLLFWCMLCTATQDISSSRENVNGTARVSRLSFRFFWSCYNTTKLSNIQWNIRKLIKLRFNNRNQTFRNQHYLNKTYLWKYICQLNRNRLDFQSYESVGLLALISVLNKIILLSEKTLWCFQISVHNWYQNVVIATISHKPNLVTEYA